MYSGDQIQGLMNSRQAVYHWVMSQPYYIVSKLSTNHAPRAVHSRWLRHVVDQIPPTWFTYKRLQFESEPCGWACTSRIHFGVTRVADAPNFPGGSCSINEPQMPSVYWSFLVYSFTTDWDLVSQKPKGPNSMFPWSWGQNPGPREC